MFVRNALFVLMRVGVGLTAMQPDRSRQRPDVGMRNNNGLDIKGNHNLTEVKN